MKQTLHYRNERAMKFTVFMTKLRHMHRIYEDEARPMSAAEKLEDLLEKIKAPFLLHQKANLESRYQMGEVNFEQASSILASAVSNSSEAKISSRISELNREDKEKILCKITCEGICARVGRTLPATSVEGEKFCEKQLCCDCK